MKRNLLGLLLLILAPIYSAVALDLTPSVSEYTAEGITFRELIFKDGKRQVSYEPPRLWSCRGAGNRLQLTPPNVDRADAVVETVEAKAPQKLDEKAIDALREQFLRSLPPGSQAVTMVSEEHNPVSLENSASYAFTASYSAIGESFVRSVIFVQLPESQLTFRLTTRKADYQKVQGQFRSSIFSWHWVDPAKNASTAPVTASN